MKPLYIFLLFGIVVNAQTPKQNFTKAEEFYKNGNYAEAVAQTERVKKSLGKSNPKVEALLFLGYYNTQDYTKAKVAYETLKLMVPYKVGNSSEFALYKSTGEQLDKKLAEIQTAFEKKQNQGSKPLYSYSQYEDKNDIKERRIERKKEAFDNRMEKIQENNKNEASQVLEQILKNPSKEKFENYLLEERYGDKFEDVKKYLKYWDETSFMIFDYDSSDTDKKSKLETLGYHLNIDFLNISGSKIIYIPKSIFTRGTLTKIAINRTSITSLPDNITNNKDLGLLTLKFNKKLNKYPEDLSAFVNLQILILQNNKYSEFPLLGHSINLRKLYLNQHMENIPNEIFNLKKLKELGIMTIRPSQGFEFPEELGRLTNLEVLELNHSYVKELPKSIKNLVNLKELNLFNTSIEDLPSELKELSNLKLLRVGGIDNKPYNNKKVERALKKLVKALPNLKVEYN
ncbi:hypothetical protein [Psychroflexus sp. MES1-P1E]|uniref:hypothetical protein n=1 Tax=Psychroflexus sp. MES1-P1E TaxID=2058320 RepID=UPI000C7D4D58|nr:hypothetical protein [Psychroflexus sp. MES1-P1E]PKG42544.1 hypothetical protein CXF67_09700 [Psychroflexus sp. MES1-P1E]